MIMSCELPLLLPQQQQRQQRQSQEEDGVDVGVGDLPAPHDDATAALVVVRVQHDVCCHYYSSPFVLHNSPRKIFCLPPARLYLNPGRIFKCLRLHRRPYYFFSAPIEREEIARNFSHREYFAHCPSTWFLDFRKVAFKLLTLKIPL